VETRSLILTWCFISVICQMLSFGTNRSMTSRWDLTMQLFSDRNFKHGSPAYFRQRLIDNMRFYKYHSAAAQL